MTEETRPGELGRDDAALQRLAARLQKPVPPLDRDELLLIREVLRQWTYDQQRRKDEAAAKLERRAALPLKVAIGSACMTAVGWAVNFIVSKFSGHP